MQVCKLLVIPKKINQNKKQMMLARYKCYLPLKRLHLSDVASFVNARNNNLRLYKHQNIGTQLLDRNLLTLPPLGKGLVPRLQV
jgi:hypothetical protein